MRLIDADAMLAEDLTDAFVDVYDNEIFEAIVERAPTIDAVPVTAAELKHLINDTIAYIWKLEDRGADKPEFGYDSRKSLLKKLEQFEKEHFPELDCSYGERKENGDEGKHSQEVDLRG